MLKKAVWALLIVCSMVVNFGYSGEIKKVGVTVGSLGNPAFVAMGEGVKKAAFDSYPNCEVVVVSGDYDLAKQSQQLDDFISAGMDVIILNAVDGKGIAPAVKRVKEAGIIIVAMDVGADGGVDATITSNNIEAGRVSAQFIIEKLDGKGNVIILNGPPVTAIMDRVTGAKEVFAKYPDIKILSDNQNGLAARDESYRIMGDLITAYPNIDAVFAINDPAALGCELAIKQADEENIIIVGVDGAPDALENMENSDSLLEATAAQQIKNLGYVSMDAAIGIANGKKLKTDVILMPVVLINKENVAEWPVWGPVGTSKAGVELWQ